MKLNTYLSIAAVGLICGGLALLTPGVVEKGRWTGIGNSACLLIGCFLFVAVAVVLGVGRKRRRK